MEHPVLLNKSYDDSFTELMEGHFNILHPDMRDMFPLPVQQVIHVSTTDQQLCFASWQWPLPATRLVWFTQGTARAHVFDLRKDSKGFGGRWSFEVRGNYPVGDRLVVPRGFAYGFQSLSPVPLRQIIFCDQMRMTECEHFMHKNKEGEWILPSHNLPETVPVNPDQETKQ